MGIIYFITVLMLITTFLLWKKKDEKVNFLKYLVISIVLIFCYNIIICYILNIFNIKINLISISIINIMCSILMLIKILKDKEIQKYYIHKKDIFAFIMITLFVCIISYLKFGFPLHINYATTDPAVHYENTIKFVNEENLVKGNSMPGAYINTGLIVKALSGIVDEFYYYQIFIGFDIFMWLISALMMYVTLVDLAKTKVTYLIIIIVSILYAGGYPLNSLLFGFEYLSMSIIIMNCILCIIEEYKEDIIKNKQVIIMMFLLETGICFTYLIFIPIIYSATFFYLVISFKKDILKKENLFGMLWVLFIPALIGTQYNIFPLIPRFFIENPAPDEETIIKLEGWIYRNLYSNILLLLPIPIIYFKNNKEEEKNFSGIFLLESIIIIGIGFFAFLFELISSYYEAKLYFMLWIILIYINAKGLIYLYNKNKLKAILPLCGYLICVITFLLCRNVKIENYWISNTEKIYTIAEIFEANKHFIKTDYTAYNDEKIEILKYVKENLYDSKDEIGTVGELETNSWSTQIVHLPKLQYRRKPIDLEKWIDGSKYEYVIYFTDSPYFMVYRNEILSGKQVVMQNESGGILKK